MCGRYTLGTPADAIAEHFALESVPELEARFNVAPSQGVPIVLARPDGRRAVGLARWGLAGPASSRKPAWAFINARAETVAERPAFRASYEKRRCLVPADGFYEWRRENGKQPYFFRMRGGRLFAFAGIWARDEEGAVTFAILTTRPNELVASVHQRMPSILEPRSYGRWVQREAPGPDRLAELCRPVAAEEMEMWPVSRRVNSPRNDSRSLIDPLPTA